MVKKLEFYFLRGAYNTILHINIQRCMCILVCVSQEILYDILNELSLQYIPVDILAGSSQNLKGQKHN